MALVIANSPFTLEADRGFGVPATALGGELVYSTSAPYPPQAYGVRTTGSQGVRLPLPVNNIGMAGISPDGKQVAVAFSASEDGSSSGFLQVAAPDGSHKRTIWKFLGQPTGAPAWNPAGTEVAITVYPGQSRDGSNFPGAIGSGLWVLSVNGGRPHRIAPAAYGFSTADVAWSPTGASLVYTTANGTSVTVRTIPAKGGPYRQLAKLTPYATNVAVYTSVAWSPKRNKILIDFYQQAYNGSPLGHSEVQQVPSGGGPLETLLPANPSAYYTGATYSPDGKRIALITTATPPPGMTTTLPDVPVYSWTLNTLTVNGSKVQTIATLPRDAQLIGWLNKLK